jgi:hypothetical protein
MSHEKDPALIARMLDYAQDFVASVDFDDIEDSEIQLKAWCAFDEGPRAFLRRPSNFVGL